MTSYSGETGIRTLGTLRFTRFPSVPDRPLWHLSFKYRRKVRPALSYANCVGKNPRLLCTIAEKRQLGAIVQHTLRVRYT